MADEKPVILNIRRGKKISNGKGRALSPGHFLLQVDWVRILSVVAVLLSLCLPQATYAQPGDALLVLPPDSTDFPILTLQFTPAPDYDPFTATLGIEDLTVLENGHRVPILGFDRQRAGVHFTLVINGERRFDLHDAAGETPYDRIRTALTDWAQRRSFRSGDSLSLVTHEGATIRNTSDRTAWIEVLDNYQPNFRTMLPDLTGLETALRLSDERVVPFGVDKTLLYITPPPAPDEIAPLLTLAESARAAGIRVNVWMLGDQYFLSNDQGGALINLAEVTGGQIFAYTGVEDLPDPETYLEELGFYYDVRFESGIRETGTYSIKVSAATEIGDLSGESGEFYIDVQPPKPILLSPPAVVQREAPPGWGGDGEDLVPTSLNIEFMLEFPDHRPRELVVSRLYVDGRLADERTEPPFESLQWDLSALTEDGEHSLQVVVEDALGLTGETILTPLQVVMAQPEPANTVSVQQVGLVVVGAILVAAVILLIFWLGHLFFRSAFFQHFIKKRFDSSPKLRESHDAQLEDEPHVYATLLPLESDGTTDLAAEAIPILQRHTALGTDPDRVDQVLTGADIEGVHARLRAVEGEFWLNDSGSAGGTWVNYAPIGRDPVQIFPGDVVHFGRLGFRFTIIDSQSPPRATVSKYQPL